MDETLRKMSEWKWLYADQDPEAVQELEKRIAEAASNEEDPTISYSDLVRGVLFHLPDGQTYEIKDFQNHGFESRLIGDYLGYISKNSYENFGFMASAVVVLKDEKKPSSPFFQWMNKLGILNSRDENVLTEFWINQINKAHNHYGSILES